MSKGLSRQQLQILGLAVAISRYRNGEPMARVPRPHRDYRVPIVTGHVWPDLRTDVCAHVLGGVGLRSRTTQWGREHGKVWLETTQPALTARSSISRAIASLLKRGHLAYRPIFYDWRSPSPGEQKFGSGYCLTATGLAAGLPHEMTVPDLGFRLWLLDEYHHKERPADWQTPDFLPSPGDETRKRQPMEIAA